MESIRLLCRCERQIVDCTWKISRQRIGLLHFPHHNRLAWRPIPCLLFHKIQAHMKSQKFHWRDILHISINQRSIQHHSFFFSDIDFPTKLTVMSQTQCSKSKTLQVWECRFILLFVITTVDDADLTPSESLFAQICSLEILLRTIYLPVVQSVSFLIFIISSPSLPRRLSLFCYAL